jgi:hypothetical protein
VVTLIQAAVGLLLVTGGVALAALGFSMWTSLRGVVEHRFGTSKLLISEIASPPLLLIGLRFLSVPLWLVVPVVVATPFIATSLLQLLVSLPSSDHLRAAVQRDREVHDNRRLVLGTPEERYLPVAAALAMGVFAGIFAGTCFADPGIARGYSTEIMFNLFGAKVMWDNPPAPGVNPVGFLVLALYASAGLLLAIVVGGCCWYALGRKMVLARRQEELEHRLQTIRRLIDGGLTKAAAGMAEELAYTYPNVRDLQLLEIEAKRSLEQAERAKVPLNTVGKEQVPE